MRVINRGRHKRAFDFGAGIAKHNALIARTLFCVKPCAFINAGGNINGLSVQKNLNISVSMMEARLLITDIFDGGARDSFDFIFGHIFAARFARDNNFICCR